MSHTRSSLRLLPDLYLRLNVAQGGSVSDSVEVPNDHTWYDIVRRSDGEIICSFPSAGRHLIYRANGIVSMRPLLPDEEIFTLNGFMRFAERLGYRVTPPSDNMKSTA